MRNQIFLHRGKAMWMAEYVGPHSVIVSGLFNSNVLPTAFGSGMSSVDVVNELQKLNGRGIEIIPCREAECSACVEPAQFAATGRVLLPGN